MNIIDCIRQARLNPLAEQFTRFCAEIDAAAAPEVLATVATLAHRNANDGDTCLDLKMYAGRPLLLAAATEETGPQTLVTAPDIDIWCKQLSTAAFTGKPGDYQPLILDGTRLYLHRHWREEKTIAQSLKARFSHTQYDSEQLKAGLDSLFVPWSADDRGTFGQKLAAAMALTCKLSIITGGPGTGKTTTVTRILALLLQSQPELRICLAAPTGKAATRLSESINQQLEKLSEKINSNILEKIPREASTIHRLLGWQLHGFVHNEGNPLACDCLLVDETSMVSQSLMASLLSALPEHCHVILLGDREQLSSVEAGSVLGDLTGNGKAFSLSADRATELSELLGELPTESIDENNPAIADHIAHLSVSYRFSGDGGIGLFASAVNNGDSERAIKMLEEKNEQLAWIEASGPRPGEKVINWAVEHYRPIFSADSAEQALAIFESARILTAMRRGPWGESEIQQRLEVRLHEIRKRNDEPDTMNKTIYRGLPLLIRRNDRETGLFNGDTGIFWPDKGGTLMAWLPIKGCLTAFSVHQLPDWQPAWALTVHRSQGSEYANVLMVLPPEESPVVSRELIYTGITRAVKHCTVTASKTELSRAVRRQIKRYSGLSERVDWPSR